MFKGKVYLSKRAPDQEERIEREFDNEKEFNDFIDKNPDLKKLREFDWRPVTWADSLLEIEDSFRRTDRKEQESLIEKMENDMKKFFENSKKLLGK